MSETVYDGMKYLFTSVLENAVKDLKPSRQSLSLERKLDAVLFLVSEYAEDLAYFCGGKDFAESPLKFILNLAFEKYAEESGNVLCLFKGLNKEQARRFRELILQELPKLRRQVLLEPLPQEQPGTFLAELTEGN